MGALALVPDLEEGHAMPMSDVTLPELARWLDRDAAATRQALIDMRNEMREDMAAIRDQLAAASVNLVSAERYRLEQEHQDSRILALELAAKQAREERERRRFTVALQVVGPIVVATLIAWLASKGLVPGGQ